MLFFHRFLVCFVCLLVSLLAFFPSLFCNDHLHMINTLCRILEPYHANTVFVFTNVVVFVVVVVGGGGPSNPRLWYKRWHS